MIADCSLESINMKMITKTKNFKFTVAAPPTPDFVVNGQLGAINTHRVSVPFLSYFLIDLYPVIKSILEISHCVTCRHYFHSFVSAFAVFCAVGTKKCRPNTEVPDVEKRN